MFLSKKSSTHVLSFKHNYFFMFKLYNPSEEYIIYIITRLVCTYLTCSIFSLEASRFFSSDFVKQPSLVGELVSLWLLTSVLCYRIQNDLITADYRSHGASRRPLENCYWKPSSVMLTEPISQYGDSAAFEVEAFSLIILFSPSHNIIIISGGSRPGSKRGPGLKPLCSFRGSRLWSKTKREGSLRNPPLDPLLN